MKAVQVEITNIRINMWDLTANTKRVLFFYKLLFRSSPIVVISVPERASGEAYAGVTAATRELTDKFGLRVVVDGSPNSIPTDLKFTGRQVVLDIDRMSRDVIEKVPEFEDLILFLKQHHLDDGVWEVFGGTPMDYIQLDIIKTRFANSPADLIVNAIKEHAYSHLLNALEAHILKSSKNTKKIIKVFRDTKKMEIALTTLEGRRLLLDFPNKVFREIRREEASFVVPSTPAVGLIISNNITTAVEVKKLRASLFPLTA